MHGGEFGWLHQPYGFCIPFVLWLIVAAGVVLAHWSAQGHLLLRFLMDLLVPGPLPVLLVPVGRVPYHRPLGLFVGRVLQVGGCPHVGHGRRLLPCIQLQGEDRAVTLHDPRLWQGPGDQLPLRDVLDGGCGDRAFLKEDEDAFLDLRNEQPALVALHLRADYPSRGQGRKVIQTCQPPDDLHVPAQQLAQVCTWPPVLYLLFH
mmetsp:Transcript_104193/g.179548  ORF Transcript_104193/g.179548 Transcript_104193/m.179548 type:complete len:204 (-) Transcript_104193:3020-3631(-)